MTRNRPASLPSVSTPSARVARKPARPHEQSDIHRRRSHGRVRYLLRMAMSNLWRNRVMSGIAITTVATMLFMLGSFFGILTGLNTALITLEHKVDLAAYLQTNVSDQQAMQLVTSLRADPRVLSVQYVSQAEALQRFDKAFASRPAYLQGVGSSSLPASIEIKVRDPHSLPRLADELRANPLVDQVSYEQQAIQRLVAIADFLRVAAAVILVILTMITLTIIVNAIRATVYHRKAEIEVMKLVGATDWFVRWPFIVEGMLFGFFGALLASLTVVLVDYFVSVRASDMLAFLSVPFDPVFLAELSGLILLFGLAIGVVGSLISIRRFLDV